MYDISFDIDNPNCIIIKKDGKIINYIACPPVENGCDIINFGDKIDQNYTFNFDGLILLTTKEKRALYHKGILITETNRHEI
jgi:hypothetical protein